MAITAALLAAVLSIPSLATAEQEDFLGRWVGEVTFLEEPAQLLVQIRTSQGKLAGSFDMDPSIAVPLQALAIDDKTIHFEMTTIRGKLVFEGKLKKNRILGEITRGEAVEKFVFERETEKHLPYRISSVNFRNGRIKLDGTLTVPKRPGSQPAMIVVGDAGPHDRNGEVAGFRPWEILADHLGRRGIAVLRWDDRGVGRSAGNLEEATEDDLVADLEYALEFLGKRREIDKRQIGLLGHGAGAEAAARVAAHYEQVAFLVLLAPDCPPEELAGVKCPVMGLSGGKDKVVLAKQMEPALKKALQDAGHRDHYFETIGTANHQMQAAKAGGPEEYESLDKEFFPGFLRLLQEWLLARVELKEDS